MSADETMRAAAQKARFDPRDAGFNDSRTANAVADLLEASAKWTTYRTSTCPRAELRAVAESILRSNA